MSKHIAREDALLQKIRRLPPEKAAAVEDFIDFLTQRDDRRLTRAMSKLTEQAFQKVWDNPDGAAYDRP